MSASVPVIDVSAFRQQAALRAAVARAFSQALESVGFAIIIGHGVPAALYTALYDKVTEFFALSLDAKMQYAASEKVKGRGYLPMGIESVAKTLSGETPPDLCEALVFSAPHRPEADRYVPNIWPNSPSGLTPLIREWTSEMLGLTHLLSRISALALDLPEGFFASAYADPSLGLRFVNYPDQPHLPHPGQLRYGEHHDYGALTILRQDSAPGGLQIKNGDGSWAEVPVVPDAFVINVGDLMARWTNNRWRSTLHRVSNPDRGLTGSTRRLSLVAFTSPHEDWKVECLPSCVCEGRPPLFEPVIAGQYVRAKLTSSMTLSAP